ncbi:MAG: prepilin-type N-terminal cleavage/methylation domain-containing protein [Acidobacteriota bacterium]
MTRGPGRASGFTLMELVIVMTVVAILMAVSIPIFITHIKHAKEVVLKTNLDEMRRAIDKYTVDKEKPPQSLQDLVSAGYLRSLPIDPITRTSESWVPVESKDSDLGSGSGDVRSGAEGSDSEGRAYSEY